MRRSQRLLVRVRKIGPFMIIKKTLKYIFQVPVFLLIDLYCLAQGEPVSLCSSSLIFIFLPYSSLTPPILLPYSSLTPPLPLAYSAAQATSWAREARRAKRCNTWKNMNRAMYHQGRLTSSKLHDELLLKEERYIPVEELGVPEQILELVSSQFCHSWEHKRDYLDSILNR